METSSNMVNKLMKKSKLTLTEFSTKVGINKGTLSSVVNSQRKISSNALMKILNSGLLSESECEQLVDCFFAEEHGFNALKKIKSFFAALTDMENSEAQEHNYTIPENCEFNMESDYEFLSDKKNIENGIVAILSYAIKNNQHIYTNFTFNNRSVDRIVYSILSEHKGFEKISRIVTFIDNKESFDNFNNVFQLIKYMQIKINTYYRIDKGLENKNEGEFYPYYFATQDMILFYEDDLSSGLFARKAEFVQKVYSKIKSNFRGVAPLCNFPQNLLSLMDDLNVVTDSEIAIRYIPHVMNLFDKNDWNDCISDEIENKAQLVDVAYDWFASERALETINLSTVDGWLNFLKTGNIPTQPNYVVPNISLDLRRKIIGKVIDNLKVGIKTHRIMNQKIKIPKNLMIERIGDYVYFITKVNDNPDFEWFGSAFIKFPIKTMKNDFQLIEKYIEFNKYLYSCEESITILQNMMAHCSSDAAINNYL